jgi:hypothetical protein
MLLAIFFIPQFGALQVLLAICFVPASIALAALFWILLAPRFYNRMVARDTLPCADKPL